MTIQLPPDSWQHVGLLLRVYCRLRQFVDACFTVDCGQECLYTESHHDKHRRLRLQWAHEGRAWKVDWYQVVFSDESRFNL
ncbi:hypothetical protein TNCV_3442961 [Trichonephila clavipes]|nr:hypothetical protein TNCV_3442961 [Trichonephila clavipes]